MDLSTMMSKIDLHQYQTVQAFVDDIDLICRNALEYNPEKDPQSKLHLLSVILSKSYMYVLKSFV